MIDENDQAKSQKALVDALMVIVKTSHIKSYLEENDPKALRQCLDALNESALAHGNHKS